VVHQSIPRFDNAVTERRTRQRTLAGWQWVVLPPLLVLVLVLGLWQWFVISHHVLPQVLPTPGRILVQGWAFRGDIWLNTVPTLKETAIGFVVSVAVAFIIAVAMDFSSAVRRSVYPLLVVSQTLPIIAIAPLLIIWFGFGLFPKVLVVALVTFFPVAVSLVEGFAATDPEATDLLRSMGASRWRTFVLLRLPGALPQFFAGLRIAITYAVVGAVFAEYVGAETGLGIYLQEQKNAARTDLVLAAVAVIAALSLLLFAATYLLQQLVIPWYRLSRRAASESGS
jgi:ABC-type nitrate/sulfonate/bicarbonate transport system permease component